MITVITHDYGYDYGNNSLKYISYYAYYGKSPTRVCAGANETHYPIKRVSRAYIRIRNNRNNRNNSLFITS